MTNTAPKFFSKLVTSTAIAAACISLGSQAMAKDVGDYDVWEFENTKAIEQSQGYVKFKGDKIIDNLVQEDIGRLGHVDIDARLTVATGVEAGPMHILGKLTSTGDVYVLDVNGFVFGKDAVIDTNSFAAIAGTVKVEDILDDDGVFTAETAKGAKIVIEDGAMISVADAGLAAFVAPTIQNAGVINARVGKVAFAAGEKVTLDLYGDKLVEIAVDDKLEDALIEHSGVINAQGGTVQISAQAAKQAVDNIINLDGVVNVTSATQAGGKIVLSGGDQGVVNVAGKLNANGATGGQVDVTGQNVYVADGAEISADGKGDAGTVRVGGDYQGEGDLDTAEQVYVAQGASISAKSTEDGEGGKVIVWSDKNTWMNGDIDASGAEGQKGGFVETSGKENLALNGSVDAGKDGEWLLDPANIRIVDGGGDGNYSGGTYTPKFSVLDSRRYDGTPFDVNAGSINAALNGDSHVTIKTHLLSVGEGNITVMADISKTAGTGTGILTLNAHNNIVIEDGVTISAASDAGKLNIELNSGNNIENYGEITTNGGDVNFNAILGDDIINEGAITTNGGDINFTALGDVINNSNITTNGGRVDFIAVANNIANNGSITTNGGVVDFDAWHKITNNGSIATNGGVVDFDAGIDVFGNPSNGDAEINTEVGSVIDARTGSVDFKSAGTITHAGSIKTTTGYVSLDNEKALVTAADSSIRTTTGDVKLDSDHSVTHDGTIQTTTGNVTLESDRLLDPFSTHVQTGADSLIQTDGGSVTVQAIGSTGVDGDIYTRGGDVKVQSIDGGNVINGTIQADAGKIGVYTKGIGSGKTIVSDTATLSTTSGDIEILSALDDIEVAGEISSHTGNVKLWTFLNLNLNGGQISGNTVNLRGATIEQDIAGAITATTLTGASATTTTLLGSANEIANLGDFSTGIDLDLFPIFTMYDQGGFTLTNTGDLNVTGSVTSYGGDIDIDTTGALDVASTGVVDASTGDVDLESGANMSITGGSVSGTTVTLVSGGNIVQDAAGTITATTLTGSSKEQTELNGTNNSIEYLDDFTTGEVSGHDGGFVLNNDYTTGEGKFRVVGAVSSQGGDIALTNTKRLGVDTSGSILSNGGNITLTSVNDLLYSRGTVDAEDGDVTLDSASKISLTDGLVKGDLVTLTAGNGPILQDAGATLVAATLTGSSTKETELLGTNNSVQHLADFATGGSHIGGFVLNNNYTDGDGKFRIQGDVSTQRGDIVISNTDILGVDTSGSVVSNGGNINLTSNNKHVYTRGTVDADTGNVTIGASSAINQTDGLIKGDTVTLTANNGPVTQNEQSTLIANTLTGSSAKQTELKGTNNDVANLDTFTTGGTHPGGFTLNDSANGLNIIGPVTTQDGAVDVDVVGDLNIANGGLVNANGGDINLFQTGFFHSVNEETVITEGDGNITLYQNVGGKIQNAIDAILNTGNGTNTLYVGPGTFNEFVTVDLKLDLLGSGKGSTFIEPVDNTNNADLKTSLLTVEAAGAGSTIDGFTFNAFVPQSGSLNGVVKVESGANGVNVTNNGFVTDVNPVGPQGNMPLELLVQGDDAVITGNMFTRTTDALDQANNVSNAVIRVSGANNTTIQNNMIDGGPIQVANSTGAILIDDNQVANTLNRDAIEVWGTDGTITISNNELAGTNKGGIKVRTSTGTLDIANNTAGSDTDGVINGITVNDFADASISGNTLWGSGSGVGINLVDSDDATVTSNTVNNFGTGIKVNSSDDVKVELNTLNGNTTGVFVTESNGVFVGGPNAATSKNTITGGTTGVLAKNSSDLTVQENEISGTKDGVRVQGISSALVSGILVDDNDIKDFTGKGVHFNYVDGGDIFDNLINSSTGSVGVRVDNSNDIDVGDDGNAFRNRIQDVKTGVIVNASTDVRLDDNDITNVQDYGIKVVGGSSNVVVEDHAITGLGGTANTGIYVSGSSDVTVGGGSGHGNDVSGFNTGIRVANSTDSEISNNELDDINNVNILVSNSNGTSLADGIRLIENDIDGGTTGIRVNGSDFVTVDDNIIQNLTGNGIQFSGSANGEIINNDIDDVANTGILLTNLSNDTLIRDNNIDGAKNGIHVYGTDTNQISGITIDDNDVSDFDNKGIALVNTFNSAVTDNVINNGSNGSVGTGVYVNKSHGVVIGGDDAANRNTVHNRINNVTNAVTIANSNDIIVGQNDVTNTARGIYAGNSFDITVKDNVLTTGTGNAIQFSNVQNSIIGGSDTDTNEITGYQNGIVINGSNGVEASWNDIEDVARDGIRIVNSDGTSLGGADNVVAKNNEITGFGRHGIYVNNSDYAEVGGFTSFDANTIDGENVGQNGVTLVNADNAFVGWNSLTNLLNDGVRGVNSNAANIFNNTVSNAGNGLHFIGSSNVLLDTNTVTDVTLDGIQVTGGTDNTAQDNVIERAGEDGIDFDGSNDFLITGNVVTESGESGIDVSNIVGGTISGNTTNDNGFAGVEITGSSDIDVNGGNSASGNEVGIYADTSSVITIDGNTTNLNDIGIYLQDVTNSLITDSITNENTIAGIKLVRVNNVSVVDNLQINENGQYGLWVAEAGSGNVIVSGNTFIDNPTAFRAESGAIDISSLVNPNTIINTNPLNTPVGLQLAGPDVSLAGNTIGGTIFSGFFTPGSYYVRFEDGTLLDPVSGAPVQINGLNASFDGFVPATQGGFLTQSDLDFLEARIYDADDAPVNGRGNLFVGQVPTDLDGLSNIEDFFNAFGYPITALAGLNVRIVGLPSVGGPSAAGLNQITPAAGGTDPNSLNNITPAAGGSEGTTPEDLNNINTEAGGDEVTCWSDAVGAGNVATLTYGGTMEDALDTADSCSNAGAI